MNMKNIKSRQPQRGISLIGLLFLGVVLAALAITGAKVVPSVTEYMAITKAVKKAAGESETVAEACASFTRATMVDYIDTLTCKDLIINKQGDKVVINFAYDKEISLVGNVYLLIKYSGTSASGYR
jgi:hypothetical protein